MRKFVVYLNGSDCCAECSEKFENGGVIMRRDSDGSLFCAECADKNKGSYSAYHVDGSCAKLIFSGVYEQLEDGIYELERCGIATSVISACGDGMSFLDYKKQVPASNYILEKRRGKAALLFPKNSNVTKSDLAERTGIPVMFIAEFEMLTGCGRALAICDRSGNVTGVASCPDLKNARAGFISIPEGFYILPERDIEAERSKSPLRRSAENALRTLTPKAMFEYCAHRVQGQDPELKKAVYMIYKYLQDVSAGRLIHADSWMLTAPSGSGKTEFFRTIRDLFRMYHIAIPVIQIDLSQITETGYKGDNVSTIPEKILAVNPDSDGTAICFLDEADKKFVPSYGSHGVDINSAIQSNMLTLIEGTCLKVDVNDMEKDFDSNKTMFILMGAFQNIRNEKHNTVCQDRKYLPLGFGVNYDDAGDDVSEAADKFHEDITMQDIIDHGMIDELAGRMTQLINFHRLSDDDMRALIKCKTKEISDEMGIRIELSVSAEDELLGISFGNLGVRRPMNIIKELSRTAVAEVFFDDGFDPCADKVVISSIDSAEVEHSCLLFAGHSAGR